jgi:hypothetical protein
MMKCTAPLAVTNIQQREQAQQSQITAKNHVRLSWLWYYMTPENDSVLENDGILVAWLS